MFTKVRGMRRRPLGSLPWRGGPSVKNQPVADFSEGASLQGRFVVVGVGFVKTKIHLTTEFHGVYHRVSRS
jgi:hypothetical protein